MTPQQTIYNGLVGISSSALGVITTFQTELEGWIRITGGLLGIAVAIITLYRFFKNP